VCNRRCLVRLLLSLSSAVSAVLADKRLLSSVQPQVPRQAALDARAVSAVLADKRLLSSVQPQVPRQAALVACAVSAVLALVHHHQAGYLDGNSQLSDARLLGGSGPNAQRVWRGQWRSTERSTPRQPSTPPADPPAAQELDVQPAGRDRRDVDFVRARSTVNSKKQMTTHSQEQGDDVQGQE
jgi:hypothetical protein